MDWRDLPIADPPKGDGKSKPTDNFKELANNHLFYFEGQADKTIKGVDIQGCAKACLLLGSGMSCKGFDYSNLNKHCVLHSELGNDEGTALIKFEDYGHFVRSDKSVSQASQSQILT